MKTKTLLFSVLVALFAFAFINKTMAVDYLGTPYGGTAWPIPGTIEAENYDLGGAGIAYNDSDVVNHGSGYRTTEAVDIEPTSDVSGAYYVGWTARGEWLKYTVDVSTAGDYYVAVRYGTQNGGVIALSFESGSDIVNASVPAPANGTWTHWGWVVMKVTLKAGVQVMTVTPGANINYISISKEAVTGVSIQETAQLFLGRKLSLIANLTPENAGDKLVTWSSSNEAVATVNSQGLVTAVTVGDADILATTDDGGFTDICKVNITNTSIAYGGTRWSIPGTIEAENYDDGGEGIAYHDAEAAQQGVGNGNFRPSEGVDVEGTSDATGGYNIGWTSLAEWIRYSVDVATAGSYNLEFRYAAGGSSSIITSFVSGADNVSVTTPAPATAGWGSFASLNATVQLKAGPQVMIVNPGVNINYYTLTLLTTTGVTGIESNSLFTLYPNPTNDVLNIKLTDFKNAELVQICDLVGVVVKTINLKQETSSIDLSSLTSGLYFVRVTSGNITKTQKFTKR